MTHIPSLKSQLVLTTPQLLTEHPALVYLSQLASRSQIVMRQSLDTIASILTWD